MFTHRHTANPNPNTLLVATRTTTIMSSKDQKTGKTVQQKIYLIFLSQGPE